MAGSHFTNLYMGIICKLLWEEISDGDLYVFSFLSVSQVWLRRSALILGGGGGGLQVVQMVGDH